MAQNTVTAVFDQVNDYLTTTKHDVHQQKHEIRKYIEMLFKNGFLASYSFQPHANMDHETHFTIVPADDRQVYSMRFIYKQAGAIYTDESAKVSDPKPLDSPEEAYERAMQGI